MLARREKSKIFRSDPRIVYIREYPDGFVANRYKWPAPGIRVITWKDGRVTREQYDRKRSYGRGPSWVACSVVGGTLQRF